MKVNPLLVVLSVLLPIVGYILYFANRGKENATTYLWSAIAGSIVGFLLVA